MFMVNPIPQQYQRLSHKIDGSINKHFPLQGKIKQCKSVAPVPISSLYFKS